MSGKLIQHTDYGLSVEHCCVISCMTIGYNLRLQIMLMLLACRRSQVVSC